MPKLGVNIDHIATLRQARRESFPDVVEAALACERAGAEGITCHLREDRRHIQDADVYALRRAIKTKLNLEMSASDEIVAVALDVRPHDVCLVPEKRHELTTEGGLDVVGNIKHLSAVVSRLKGAGITVSMFINPDAKQIEASREIGADCVELHTGSYANARSPEDIWKRFDEIKSASVIALKSGLILNSGHGLDYSNVRAVALIPGMNELNIGFSIIARAVFAGLENAVREMKKLCAE
ncbi:MAG: pyridoxine 5'-phosphate synthase [Elusimicrobia bacterium HGW-Elusimicrobia-1]|nr:MAG: pyridoxine 5'-phosphate synthase [Elusimicrobia bacterium HGW-Elusimicrobia-1]